MEPVIRKAIPNDAKAVAADNTQALRFYGNLGFQKIGTARKHVKLAGGFRDVFYMEKFLTDDS